MNRRLFFAFLLASPGAFSADPLPSAESLIDRYIQATGGREVYESRKTQILYGQVAYPAQRLSGPFVRYEANGNIYSFIQLPVASVENGVKDNVGWERSSATGPRLMGSGERAQALRERFDSLYRWREFYDKAETIGKETLNGQPCFRVVLTPKAGYPETVYISEKSGWPIKVQTVYQTSAGDLASEVNISNYQAFGGLMVPTKIAGNLGGVQFTQTIDSVEVNPVIDPNRFNLPADVLALTRRRAR